MSEGRPPWAGPLCSGLKRQASTLLVLALTACTGASSTATAPDSNSRAVDAEAAANELCPVLWAWVKDVGGIMNELSERGLVEPDPDVRLAFYAAQLEQLAVLNTELDDAVEALDGPVLDPLVDEVRAGLLRAAAQVEAMRASLAEHPELEEGRPQLRISTLFIAAEKVIDYAKPELAAYGDPALIEGFQRVDSCQHAVKDVDDGVPRFNG